MSTEYSVSVDEWDYEDWEFVGRDLEISKKGEWANDNQEGVGEDSYYPMMLYAYPLEDCPSDEKILKIHRETNLTVVKKIDTEEYFLALCGGGMDLSQDIGMAYIIAQGYIPTALLYEISLQPNLSIRGRKFRKLMREIRKGILDEMSAGKSRVGRIRIAIQESLVMDRKNK